MNKFEIIQDTKLKLMELKEELLKIKEMENSNSNNSNLKKNSNNPKIRVLK